MALLVGPAGRAQFWDFTWASFWAGGGILSDSSTFAINGQAYRLRDAEARDWFIANVYRGRSWSDLFTWFVWGGFVGGFCPAFAWLWERLTHAPKDQAEGRHLRGTRVQSAEAFTARAGRQAEASGDTLGLEIGNCRIAQKLEARHLLYVGATGVGKTSGIRQTLAQLAARGATCIVFDPECELVREFYRPARGDVILNPLDERSASWVMGDEIVNAAELPMLAAALITPPARVTAESEYWYDSARRVFADLAPRTGFSTRVLADLLKVSPDHIHRLLDGTVSLTTLGSQAPRQMSGILSTLSLPLASFDLLPASGPPWSARAWSESRQGWVFLTTIETQLEAILILISAWITLLIQRLLTTELATAAEREVWFVLDEVPTLRKLDALELLLTRGSKHGLRVVLGLQSTTALRERYGPDTSRTMLGMPATTVLFRTTDVDTSEWSARRIGEREREIAADGASLPLHPGRAGAVLPRDVRTRDLAVLASEIQDLPELQGYLAAAGLGVAEVRFTYQPPDPARLVPGFVPRALPVPPLPPETDTSWPPAPPPTPSPGAPPKPKPAGSPKPPGKSIFDHTPPKKGTDPLW